MILIGHSMGGLLLKQMLIEAHSEGDFDFINSIKGICFYSTPHRGSSLAHYATLNTFAKTLLNPTREIEELSSESQDLVSLEQNFRDLASEYKNLQNILSFTETVPTKVMYGAGKSFKTHL